MYLKPISRAGFFFHCKFYFNAEMNLRKRHISILSTRNVIWTLLGGGGGGAGVLIYIITLLGILTITNI